MKKYYKTLDKFCIAGLDLIASKIFLVLTFIWYFLQTIIIAVITQVGLPPDERWHIDLIKLYARDGPDPFIANQEGFYKLGPVTRNVNFLYHYSLSFPYRLVDFLGLDQQAVMILRFVNIAIGAATLFVVWKVMEKLKVQRMVQNLVVFMLSSTMMFIFLSSSVNYDNLLYLLTALTVYYWVQLLDVFSVKLTLKLIIVILLAVLTKSSFVPIAVLLTLIIVYAHKKKLKLISGLFRAEWAKNKMTLLLLSLIAVTLFLLAAERYVGNVILYKSVNPTCQKVLSINQCLQSPIYIRDSALAKTKPDISTIMPVDQFSFSWVVAMKDRTFGVFAHEAFSPNKYISDSIYLIGVLFFVAIIRKFDKNKKALNLLLGVSVLYYFLLLKINRGGYLSSGIFGAALQGRYGMGVLFILYAAGLHYTWQLFKNSAINRFAIATFIILVFTISSLPSYILKSDVSWYTPAGSSLRHIFKISP